MKRVSKPAERIYLVTIILVTVGFFLTESDTANKMATSILPHLPEWANGLTFFIKLFLVLLVSSLIVLFTFVIEYILKEAHSPKVSRWYIYLFEYKKIVEEKSVDLENGKQERKVIYEAPKTIIGWMMVERDHNLNFQAEGEARELGALRDAIKSGGGIEKVKARKWTSTSISSAIYTQRMESNDSGKVKTKRNAKHVHITYELHSNQDDNKDRDYLDGILTFIDVEQLDFHANDKPRFDKEKHYFYGDMQAIDRDHILNLAYCESYELGRLSAGFIKNFIEIVGDYFLNFIKKQPKTKGQTEKQTLLNALSNRTFLDQLENNFKIRKNLGVIRN